MRTRLLGSVGAVVMIATTTIAASTSANATGKSTSAATRRSASAKTARRDIQSKVSSGLTVSNTGYASLRTTDTARPSLYKVDLLSGKATKVGSFDKQVADIAVKQP